MRIAIVLLIMAKESILTIRNNIKMRLSFRLGTGMLKAQFHIWTQYLKNNVSGVKKTECK